MTVYFLHLSAKFPRPRWRNPNPILACLPRDIYIFIFFPFVFLSKLEIKIWDFISLFPDLTALTLCALVSVIKQSRLQVMDTSTRIPTGSKRKRNISQLSALFHCFPRNDLLITYKTLPGLSRATFLFSTHSWKLLFSHPIDRVQKAMGLSVSWITFISFYKSPYYYYYMSLYMVFFVLSLFFFFFNSSVKMRAQAEVYFYPFCLSLCL